MRRAATPTHIFTFPEEVEVSSVTEVLITYSQCGDTILEKTLNDLTIDTEDNSYSFTLTQQETGLFAPGRALVQLRAKSGGSALVSQMMWFNVKPALNSEVI